MHLGITPGDESKEDTENHNGYTMMDVGTLAILMYCSQTNTPAYF